jgi:hypothetical protein
MPPPKLLESLDVDVVDDAGADVAGFKVVGIVDMVTSLLSRHAH